MYERTPNPYKFKYLVTGIKGRGIDVVYLPPEPPDDQVHFLTENRFSKPQVSEQLQEWITEADEERNRKDKNGNYINLTYVHPQQEAIDEYEDMQWKRGEEGLWFWNNGKKTFITNDYYRYLTEWHPDFEPEFRDPDKETFYWIKFWEEDPRSFGGAYHGPRREGKSAKMGFWLTNRTISNFKHFAGMQGEDDTKIKAFYEQHILSPFYKLPSYRKPVYDTNTLQKKGIILNEPPRRHQRKKASKRTVLESKMDYRTSEENKYDQAKLHSFVNEEGGKTLTANVQKRWGFVKPCLKLGKYIIGKAFWGTTVEFMDTSGKGGKAYMKLCFQSDYDIRDDNDETTSGLYAGLMPADCVIEGFFDAFGIPDRKAAMQWIMNGRKAVEDTPADYATLVRKYATNWAEVFYTSAEHCEFNIRILQERDSELAINPMHVRRFDLEWENKQRFSKVIMVDNPTGWFKTTKVFTGEEVSWYNNVMRRKEGEKMMYSPTNDNRFAVGIDPIDHGVVLEASPMGEDAFVSSRKSRPVLVIKRKYDSSIDGVSDIETLQRRSKEKYPYKTGVYFAWMDTRPNDPNIFFERALMVLWLHSVTAQIESQKPGLINWINEAGCREFTWMKYVPDPERIKRSDMVQGTPASQPIIQEYTGLLSTDVEYYGHTYPDRAFTQDLIHFQPNKTREYDFAVAMGNCELGCRMRPLRPPVPERDINHYFRRFKRDGTPIRMKK